MRNALLTAALLLITLVISSGGEEPPAPPSSILLPGTDKPEVRSCPDGTAYVYKIYMIYVRQNADSPGQEIHIFKPPSPPSDPCGPGKGAEYYSLPADKTGGAGFFAGVSGDYLFVDQGTGPSYRTISILDMREKTFPLLAVRYSDAKIENGVLTYFETRDEVTGVLTKIPCPQAAVWKRQGLDVVYEEEMSFDLKTGRASSLRRFRCSPAQ
jgi:hypothetical protein